MQPLGVWGVIKTDTTVGGGVVPRHFWYCENWTADLMTVNQRSTGSPLSMREKYPIDE